MKHNIKLRNAKDQKKYLRRLKRLDECGFVATRSGVDKQGETVDRVWSWRTSYLYAWSKLGSHADAEDVTQSAYLDWSTRSYVIPARYSVNRAIGRLIRSRNADLAKIRKIKDLAETQQPVAAVAIHPDEMIQTVRRLFDHASPDEATKMQAILDSDGVVSHAAVLLGIHAARIWETLVAVRQRHMAE